MPRLALNWADLGREMVAWERSLARGLTALRDNPPPNPLPGGSARTLLRQCGKARLFRYTPLQQDVQRVPTLIVYGLVNRPSMADLQPDRSLVRALLALGVDVHLIEWEDPTALDRQRGLNEYINQDLAACVDWLAAAGPINMMGICQGGTFGLCYAALNPARVRNLVLTVTPVDFHTPEDLLSHLLRAVDIERLGEQNLRGDALNSLFLALKPYRLLHQKYVGLVEQMTDPAALALFLRMEKWIFDSPDLAGLALQEFARDFYRDNALWRGRLRLGGQRVALARLTMPVLNVYASADHLVPPASSRGLAAKIGSTDYQELEVPGGHIGIYVGSARSVVARSIGQWLGQRSAL